MRVRALLALALSLGSCIQNPTSNSSDAGAAATGVNCGTDPTSGVTLCLGTTQCPGGDIPQDTLEGCGYQTVVPSFDLECLCNGTSLCPIGVAATCADVSTLIGKRTLADICNQISDGTCKPVAASAPSGTGGSSSTCAPTCTQDCAGSPICLTSCCGS